MEEAWRIYTWFGYVIIILVLLNVFWPWDNFWGPWGASDRALTDSNRGPEKK